MGMLCCYVNLLVSVNIRGGPQLQRYSIEDKGCIRHAAVVDEIDDGVESNCDFRVLKIHHREAIVVHAAYARNNHRYGTYFLFVPGLVLYNVVDNLPMKDEPFHNSGHFFVSFSNRFLCHIYFITVMHQKYSSYHNDQECPCSRPS